MKPRNTFSDLERRTKAMRKRLDGQTQRQRRIPGPIGQQLRQMHRAALQEVERLDFELGKLRTDEVSPIARARVVLGVHTNEHAISEVIRESDALVGKFKEQGYPGWSLQIKAQRKPSQYLSQLSVLKQRAPENFIAAYSERIESLYEDLQDTVNKASKGQVPEKWLLSDLAEEIDPLVQKTLIALRRTAMANSAMGTLSDRQDQRYRRNASQRERLRRVQLLVAESPNLELRRQVEDALLVNRKTHAAIRSIANAGDSGLRERQVASQLVDATFTTEVLCVEFGIDIELWDFEDRQDARFDRLDFLDGSLRRAQSWRRAEVIKNDWGDASAISKDPTMADIAHLRDRLDRPFRRTRQLDENHPDRDEMAIDAEIFARDIACSTHLENLAARELGR